MSELSDPEHLADWLLATTKSIYDRDGYVVPTCWLAWPGHRVGCMLGEGHPPEVAAQVITVMAAVYQLDYVGLASESWYNLIRDPTPEQIERARQMQRGELQKRSETDPDVRTALVVYVIDAKDASQDWYRMTVTKGDPRDHQWDDMPGIQIGGGFIPDALRTALEVGTEAYGQSPTEDLATVLGIIGKLGLITAAIMSEDDED